MRQWPAQILILFTLYKDQKKYHIKGWNDNKRKGKKSEDGVKRTTVYERGTKTAKTGKEKDKFCKIRENHRLFGKRR